MPVGIVEYITNNLGSNPISNIIMIQADEACPTDYEDHPIGIWLGNFKGCPFKENNCTKTVVDDHDPKILYAWGDQKFCVLRNKNFKFLEIGHCHHGYKECSYHVCVSFEEECPVTSVQFIESPYPFPTISTEKVYKSTRFLDVERTNTTPLYNLEYSLKGKPCVARGWSMGKENPFILLRNKHGCSPYGQDEEAIIIDSMSETSLYYSNGMANTLSELADYKDSIAGEKAYLISRKRIALSKNPECLWKPKSQSLVLAAREIEDKERSLTILGHLLILPLIPSTYYVMVMLAKRRSYEPEEYAIKIRLNILFTSLLYIGALVLICSISLAFYKSYNILQEGSEGLEKMKKYSCFENKVYERGIDDFFVYLESIGEVKTQITVLLIVILLSYLPVMLLILAGFFWKKPTVHSEIENQPSELDDDD